MTNHFADFPADDLDTAPAAKIVTARQTFPCTSCGGSGKWTRQDRYGRDVSSDRKCYACRGAGVFLTDEKTRKAHREAAWNSKAKKLENTKGGFEDQHPGLVKSLTGMTDWNSFAASLVQQFAARGTLSDNQVAAAERMIAKTETTRAANQAAREVNKVEVDLAPIRVMFEAAVRSGHKRPVYRAEGLVISRAPDSGKNPGALYVKDTGSTYGGKVVEATYSPNYDGNRADFAHYSYDVKNETGKVVETVTVRQSATEALNKIAADPREASATWGRRTGSCSCCGRELTKTASIEAGIGPICAEKWSL